MLQLSNCFLYCFSAGIIHSSNLASTNPWNRPLCSRGISEGWWADELRVIDSSIGGRDLDTGPNVSPASYVFLICIDMFSRKKDSCEKVTLYFWSNVLHLRVKRCFSEMWIDFVGFYVSPTAFLFLIWIDVEFFLEKKNNGWRVILYFG